MRVGIIGRGWGERVVAPAFEGTEGCEVVEVVTPRDEAAVAALCRRDDIDLDLRALATVPPPRTRPDGDRGGHAVLCDKPFGRHIEDAEAMSALADDAGVLGLVNFQQRYDAGRIRLRQLVAGGAIGEPEHVDWTMLLAITRAPPTRPYGWIFDDDLGGGWLRAAGSHLVDFVRWSLGEVTEAYGQMRTAVSERPDAGGNLHRCTADDGFVANLRTERGVTVVIDSSWAAPVNLTPSMAVIGSTGVLEVTGERVVLHDGDGAREVFTPRRRRQQRHRLPARVRVRGPRRAPRGGPPRRHPDVRRRPGVRRGDGPAAGPVSDQR